MTMISLPTYGLDANGDPMTLYVDENQQTIASNNSQSMGTRNTAWQITQVQSIKKATNNDIVGIGYGVNQSGTSINLVWKFTNGQWIIGDAQFVGNWAVRESGLTHNGTKYALATGEGIFTSNFNYTAPSPSGGLSTTPQNYGQIIYPVDSLDSNGSTIVGTSMSVTGTWTGNNVSGSDGWTHNVGEVVPLKTGHLKTSYTFPGYAGSNAQTQHPWGCLMVIILLFNGIVGI